MDTKAIEVRLWNKRVGAIAADPRAGCYAFEYTPQWIRSGVELAPLMMPLSSAGAPFVFPAINRDTYRGLPGLLSDSLPDDFGNALIDAWMAQQGTTRDQVTTLDRLAYMGARGMGALSFRPARGLRKDSAAPLDMRSMVEAARRVLDGDLSNDTMAQAALANIIRVGTSAGGARAKAVVAWNPETDQLRSGQFDVAAGFEHWLLKFDGVGSDSELGTGGDYGRIEYAYHLMAREAGIGMAPCRLLHENGRAHFMTKRFDRDGNARHHVQSLCAMVHLDYRQRATHAYEQLFQLITQLKLGDQALQQVFLRMAFNFMAANADDHTKNFSMLLREGGRWELAPAYDLTHAFNPKGEWTYQHLMSVNGRFEDVARTDLMVLAERFMVPAAARLLAQVRAALSGWPAHAKLAGLQPSAAARIAQDFRVV